MNRKKREKVTMYRLLQNTAAEFHSEWENIPKFAEAMQAFNMKVESLCLAAEQQHAYTLGVKDKRDNLKKDTIELTMLFVASLRAYAFDNSDFELFAQINVSKSKFSKMTQMDTLIAIDRILSHALTYAGPLEEYGMTVEKLEQFQICRDQLSTGILTPREAILKKKNQTAIIASLDKEINQLLKFKIDRMMKIFEVTNPEFFRRYTNARKVTTVVYHNSSGTETPPEVDDGID